MQKNILVLEDNKNERERLVKCIEEIKENVKIYQTASAEEARTIAVKNDIDMFLVDIILDAKKERDISGINFAEEIREIEKYRFTPLIFTTALKEHKFYTFTNMHKEAIRFYIGEKDIVYVKAIDYRLHIQTVDEEIIIHRKNYIEMMSILSEKRFVQCSRSAIVNRYFVERFERTNKCIVLKEPYGTIAVGSTYMKKMEEEF